MTHALEKTAIPGEDNKDIFSSLDFSRLKRNKVRTDQEFEIGEKKFKLKADKEKIELKPPQYAWRYDFKIIDTDTDEVALSAWIQYFTFKDEIRSDVKRHDQSDPVLPEKAKFQFYQKLIGLINLIPKPRYAIHKIPEMELDVDELQLKSDYIPMLQKQGYSRDPNQRTMEKEYPANV